MIIGFAGRKRSGKTCLSSTLQKQRNAVIITIANYLKKLCCELLNMTQQELNEKKDNGYTFDVIPDERWFNIISERCSINAEDVKKELQGRHITSIREILQVVGTDVIRKYNENWHVSKMIEEIKSYPDEQLIAIDDVRFPNEKKAIEDLGGRVIFIVRPTNISVSNHVSETSLKWQDFDVANIIINSQSEQYLINEFLWHFDHKNHMSFKPYSIFLFENLKYLPCSNFGNAEDTDKELLNAILLCIKDDEQFIKTGQITFKTCSKELAKKYIYYVDNFYQRIDTERCYTFKTYNPLITENLKRYI